MHTKKRALVVLASTACTTTFPPRTSPIDTVEAKITVALPERGNYGETTSEFLG